MKAETSLRKQLFGLSYDYVNPRTAALVDKIALAAAEITLRDFAFLMDRSWQPAAALAATMLADALRVPPKRRPTTKRAD